MEEFLEKCKKDLSILKDWIYDDLEKERKKEGISYLGFHTDLYSVGRHIFHLFIDNMEEHKVADCLMKKYKDAENPLIVISRDYIDYIEKLSEHNVLMTKNLIRLSNNNI